eukprot:snap_masked-scaffold_43-processed-gene-0.25-mRNA-1 protein AED:1.00 eAED:1.00 QI:0/0/0/0/1/1/2/0/80
MKELGNSGVGSKLAHGKSYGFVSLLHNLRPIFSKLNLLKCTSSGVLNSMKFLNRKMKLSLIWASNSTLDLLLLRKLGTRY